MIKVLKYSKEKLLKFIKLPDSKVYLLFYDLNCENLNETTDKLSDYMEITGTKIVRVGKTDCAAVFGCLNDAKLEEFVSCLDSMDIGEFDVSEYRKYIDISAPENPFDKEEGKFKKIYVNKDEKIIQLYNFQ